MKRSLIGLIAPLAALALVACGPEEEESTVSTGGTTTTEEGVEISLGSGSGSSFNEGVMSATVGSSSLSAGGTTTVTVNIVNVANNNSLYTGVPVEVQFASSCVDDGKASFSRDSVSTSTGTATTVYQAEGCVGNDAVSASVGTATAAVSISVSPADVNSIGFSSISSSSIAYGNSSTETQPSISEVVFQLLDVRGNPVEGQTVSFSLSSPDANTGVAISNTSAVSDSDGLVQTRVSAGTSAANVRVVAVFTPAAGDPISTQSPSIAVNTGPADVDSFSLSISGACVASAYNVDGVTTTMSVQVADRHNNPVADGTSVSFWTEYGRIQPSCTTSDGACSVDWTSGGLRPGDGLSTVVAYTTGEDSFIDRGEKNGIYNVDSDQAELLADETIISISEMYYDYDYDGSYTAGTDDYTDYNGNGTYQASSAKYRGALCSDGAVSEGHCAETAVQVWADSQIALNTNGVIITPNATPWSAIGFYTVSVTDSLGNYPPAGTTISVTPTDDAAVKIYNSPVPSLGECTATAHTFTVSVEDMGTAGGSFVVEVTLPNGSVFFTTVSQ